MKLADHFGIQLASVAQSDPRIVVLDGDLADSDGAVHFAKRHPSRFYMAGIAEQNMVSMAAGMAEAGARPFVFSFAAFLCYRAYDQIRVCLSQARQPVVLVASHAGGLSGRNGKTHTASNDLALMLTLPDIAVWAPADLADVKYALQSILSGSAPAYVRLPRRVFTDAEQLPGCAATVRWLAAPRRLTLVSTGLASHWALQVLVGLRARGIDAGLLHCAELAPVPPFASLLANVEDIVVIEDHHIEGGLASLVQQATRRRHVRRFGWPPTFTGQSGDDARVRARHGLDAEAICGAIAGGLDGNRLQRSSG